MDSGMLLIYLCLSVVVLLLFVVQHRVFSHAYLALLLLLVVSLICLPFYHVVNVSLLSFALLLPLFRLLYLVFFEVKYVLSVMRRRRSVAAIIKTFLLWLPFPLLAVLGYWMLAVRDHHLAERVDAYIYGIDVSPAYYACGSDKKLVCRCENFRLGMFNGADLSAQDCPLVDSAFYVIPAQAGEMQRDIHTTVERLKEAFRVDIVNRLKSKRQEIKKAIDGSGADLEKVLFDGKTTAANSVKNRRNKQWPLFKYTLAQYHPDLLPPPCNGVIDQIFKLRDCVKNIGLEPLSNTYIDIRHDVRAQVIETVLEGKGSTDQKLSEIERLVEEVVDQHLRSYSRSAHQVVENHFATFSMIDKVSFLLWLVIVVYALLLGFLYLFIRYVYNQRHGKVPFRANTTSPYDNLWDNNKKQSVIAIDDITIDDAMNSFSQTVDDELWYASMDSALRYEVDGIICLPRPLTLLWKRLPGRYFLFRYSRKEGKKMISAHADDLTRFIKITLQERQAVCFDFSNLVAFSGRTQLQATLSISLAAFFQNQLFFSTALGPGELILRTKSGKPEIMPEGGIKPSDPRDVILFDLQGDYSLLADLNPLSVYFLGHRVVPGDNTVLIRQSPDAKSSFSSQASAIRRTLYLLLPLTFVTVVLPWILP